MSLLKVIVVLLMISTAVVDSRARRKRRQLSLQGPYFGGPGSINSIVGAGYPLYVLGVNGYPIGNNWYLANNQANPYYNQLPFQPYPGVTNYGYSNWLGNSAYSLSNQGYTGQSYVPINNEWLPLPGRDRRKRSFENVGIRKMNNNLAVSKDK